MILALLLATLPGDGFRAVQYAANPVVLRGCAECQGEPDDVCEVRGGVQSQRLDEYAQGRWPAPGRIKLLRSKADPDCAVPVAGRKGFFSGVELAAIRIAPSPPPATILESGGHAVHGWPHAPQRRQGEAFSAQPQRTALREALVCWPSEKAWPWTAALDKNNSCERWLLAVRPDSGDPDLAGASFPLGKPFNYDPAMTLERASAAAAPAAPAPAPAPAPALAPPAPPVAAGPVRCGNAARAKAATLDRFDQWDEQIRGSSRPSLDRASWALNAAAWSGHCQELDVLRAALEQQLVCAVDVQGKCAGLVGRASTEPR